MAIKKQFVVAFCVTALIATSPMVLLAQEDTLVFPEFVFTEIKGAPKLSSPVLLMAGDQPAMAGGLGWASPAVWDWNHDGKKDLLIGEFWSGVEHGQAVGSFIRVYQNAGTDAAPQFTKDFYYARTLSRLDRSTWGIANYSDNGTPMSIAQFCCQSFKPEFVDLNDDGVKDIVAASYYPGDVSWFKGFGRGFLTSERLPQEGFPETPKEKRGTAEAVAGGKAIYSSVSFGDFTGDGLQDMLFSTAGFIRISKNIGTKTNPKFGPREIVLDPSGKQVLSQHNAIPTVVDWDQDGVLDVLTTGGYASENSIAVLFFKGVKTGRKYSFEQGIPLFKAKDPGKAFPGTYLNSFVTDWNNDGVNDLLIGTRISAINKKPIPAINWGYIYIKDDPGYFSDEYKRSVDKRLKVADSLEASMGKEAMAKKLKETNHSTYQTRAELLRDIYGGKEEYKSMTHIGYVYLMLGQKK